MKKSDDINIAEKIAECVSQIGGTCYFVGGYIRDKIMGNPGKDVDIEVHGITPSELEAILDSIGTRIETGKRKVTDMEIWAITIVFGVTAAELFDLKEIDEIFVR